MFCDKFTIRLFDAFNLTIGIYSVDLNENDGIPRLQKTY